MLKQDQKDKLESYGFKRNVNDEYELKFDNSNNTIIWSIAHQMGAYYYEGETSLLYDFYHMLDVLDYLDIKDLIQ